jgi:hypothetical protein
MNRVRPALLVGTDVELGAGALSIDEDRNGGGRTVARRCLAVVWAIEDAGLSLPTVEKMRVGDLHRLFAQCA